MQEIIQFIDNHPMLSLAWILLLAAVIFISFQSWCSKVIKITRDEAIYLINKKDAVIIDLRSRDDYCKGHIVNSLNMASIDIKNGNLSKIENAKRKLVVVVCRSDMVSCDFAKNLYKAGFKWVYVMKEGISGWNRENLPLVVGDHSS